MESRSHGWAEWGILGMFRSSQQLPLLPKCCNHTAMFYRSMPRGSTHPAQGAMESTSSTPLSVTPQWDVFPQKTLGPIDITILVLYFVFVLAVGLWVRI